MNNSYCVKVFNHIYTDPQNNYRLCCHASRTVNPLSRFNSEKDLPFDVFFSDEYEDIRFKMLSNERIETCDGCQYREPGNLTEVEKVDIKLTMFGNECNLGCVMCEPGVSSFKQKENKKIGITEDNQYDITFFESLPMVDEKYMQHLLDNIQYISSFTVKGGEPFLMKEHYELLDRVTLEYAKDITLIYYTNLSLNIDDILEKYKHFKDISLVVSLDHYGKELERIRYPIKSEVVEENLKKYKDYIIGINCTVSIMNIEDLNEIKEYYKEFHVNFSEVDKPVTLSIRNHPKKEEYKERYKDIETIYNELCKEGKEEWYKLGLEYIDVLDNHRKL